MGGHIQGSILHEEVLHFVCLLHFIDAFLHNMSPGFIPLVVFLYLLGINNDGCQQKKGRFLKISYLNKNESSIADAVIGSNGNFKGIFSDQSVTKYVRDNLRYYLWMQLTNCCSRDH